MMLPCGAPPFALAKVTVFDGGPHIGRYTQRSFLALTAVAGAPHTPVEASRHLIVAGLEREERRAVIGSAQRARVVEIDGAVLACRHHQLPIRDREGDRAA